jgi:hypothetical protein
LGDKGLASLLVIYLNGKMCGKMAEKWQTEKWGLPSNVWMTPASWL